MTQPAPAAPVRFCTVCKQADDHPRHDIWGTDPNVAPHMDCCSSVGCPDGTCDVVVRSKGEKVGDAFRAQITGEAFAAKTAELLERRDSATRSFTLAGLNQGVHGSVQQATTDLEAAR